MLGACSINKVILMGRLTSDPELRQTPNGVSTDSHSPEALSRAGKSPVHRP